MLTFYIAIIAILFILAVSDLVVGVSNDAVNFLNSAVGSRTASFKTILFIAALGILVGCTFSSGMMEVARKGIFHPEHFYFSEIILLFLAVMVTDVILLDAFNTLGMPTSTTVSIVFELLGAAVAFSIIKTYTDPNALSLAEYINSSKALEIVTGILVSVFIAFTVGLIMQYITRLLFSFDYTKSVKYFGGIWGGLAFGAITYFMLIKGAKGATFITSEGQAYLENNTFTIITISMVVWTIVLQLITVFTKIDIFKIIVLVGTFALAMAFAGNDLVNFIGVPLAGYNSYELFAQSQGADPDTFLMQGLAGKVSTPLILLLLSGIVMVITLWNSKKAKSVLQTSLDLGRQHEGSEKFSSYAISRSIVRSFSRMSKATLDVLPEGLKHSLSKRFDETSFTAYQKSLGKEAPAFDMVRAASTLVIASILISLGTSLKLPLSTTYVTFMVFMGTSLADGAWGRESAVYRVSGVLSVIGGWFFTAFSAFLVAFVIANLFYFGSTFAIVGVLLLAGYLMYRTHRFHDRKMEEDAEIARPYDDNMVTKDELMEMSRNELSEILIGLNGVISDTITGLANEDLPLLKKTNKHHKSLAKKIKRMKRVMNEALDKIEDDNMETSHLYILTVDYLNEMVQYTGDIIVPSLDHVDNNHKPLLPEQIDELRLIQSKLEERINNSLSAFKDDSFDGTDILLDSMDEFLETIRVARKNQIKRIKNHVIGTRNSLLFFNHLGELRNFSLFTNRLVRVYRNILVDDQKDI